MVNALCMSGWFVCHSFHPFQKEKGFKLKKTEETEFKGNSDERKEAFS